VTLLEGPDLRRIAGHFPTGVAVVTAHRAGAPCGLTVNSFTTVSLEPPLILVCIARHARAHACMAEARRFAVNVLAEDQEDLARLFASLAEDKFAGLAYSLSPGGAPLLQGSHAWLDCEEVGRHDGGRTHDIVVGRVTAGAAGRGRPLAFYASRYARLATSR